MKKLQIALLVAIVSAGKCLFAQVPPIDYRVSILADRPPASGSFNVYALLASASWWTNTLGTFTVRMTVPPQLELVSNTCNFGLHGELTYDPVAREVIWTDAFDNLDQRSCPMMFRIDPAAPPGTPFQMTATITTVMPDADPTNNAVTHANVVLAASDLEVAHSSDAERFRPDRPVTYTITVANHGPQDATEVRVTDELSPELAMLSFRQFSGPAATLDISREQSLQAVIPLLPTGSSATFQVTAQVRGPAESGIVSNRASAQSAIYDANFNNNARTVHGQFGPNADLFIMSSGAPDPSGLRVPVRITVANAGPDPVSSVTVTNAMRGTDYDPLDDIRFLGATPSQGSCSEPREVYLNLSPPLPPFWIIDCSVGTLASGATATIDLLIERKTPTMGVELRTSAAPSYNDPQLENNGVRRVFRELSLRRRPAR